MIDSPKTTDSEDWEKEFDALPTFTKHINGRTLLGDPTYREDIYVLVKKDFIREWRTAAYESRRESVNEIYLTREEAYKKGHESALREVLEIIETMRLGKTLCIDACELSLPCKHTQNDAGVEKLAQVITARLLDT